MSGYNRGTSGLGQPGQPGQPTNRGLAQPTNLGGVAGGIGASGYSVAGGLAGSVTTSGNLGGASRLTATIGRDLNRDFEGEVYDVVADYGASLRWSELPEGEQIVINSSSDASTLNRFKNILLALREEFGAGSIEGPGHIVITGERRDDFNRRLILLESEIEGLMKRRINYSIKDQEGGTRFLDYTNILNEKENQIIELEKKINNLEERLRRSGQRETELENHIIALTADLRRKDDIIRLKNDQVLAEVAASNLFRDAFAKIRQRLDQNRSQLGGTYTSIYDGLVIPEGLDIRADVLVKDGSSARSTAYQGQTSSQKYRTQLVALFREFERLGNTEGITDDSIERLLEGFILGLNGTRLRDLTSQVLERKKLTEDYERIKAQFGVAAGMYKLAIDKLKQQNPSLRIEVDRGLFDLLQNERINVERVDGGVIHLERFTERTVEVPVQDARTKHLLHLLASQLKKLSLKYPKILLEMDARLTEFFQQEIIDIIEVDEVDRVIEIVKYVPQVVKVENVYAYSSEKSKKVEFHLRILIKALLEELEKLKRRTGSVSKIDEGIIAMINQEIMGVVDVDDVLKVFRVVPKIVEVEKIVEKIVDRIVEVPEVVPIEKVVEKIIEVEKIKEVERIVNVPIEVPTVVNNIVEKIVPIEQIIERVVEVPTITEKIVEVRREFPKIVEVERIVEKVVEVDKVINVREQVNHFVPEIKEVQVIVEKLVPVEKIVEKIVEVPTFIEKIVEKVVQVPQIIEVEKIVEKIVERVDYKIEKEMIPYVQIETRIVDRIIEKPIPIIQKEEKIVQVPQIVEKIVQVTNTVQELKEVEIIKEKIVIQDRIKEIERIVEKPVPLIREVEKIVEKRVEIPVIVERVVTVPEIVTKTIIQRIENTIVKEVFIRDPLIVKQPFIMEVEKFVNHYIDVPRIVKHIEEKIVEVPRHIEKIKEVRVIVEKIIEKMVEVPKVVEVEKIIEKIVVVPRVIEKIIEVPQIIEVPVDRIIIQERIKEVERIVQVPVIQEKIVEVEVIKNVYVEVEKVVDRIVDKLVEVHQREEIPTIHEVIQEKVVEVVREVPREIEVERIVNLYIEKEKIVEIEKPIVVPVEIPVPTDRIIEKLVPVYETVEKIVQVPQIVEKIVEVRVDDVRIHEVTQVTHDVVVDTKFVEVPQDRIIIQERIKEVPTIREKIVPVTSIVQEIVTAQQIVEKIVERTVQVPKVYEVERLVEKLVEVPKIVEIETLVPTLVRVNNYVQNLVEKIVEVPIIIEKILEVTREKEKVVTITTEVPKIIEVEKIVEKAVIMEKFKEVVRNINYIEQVLQIVDRYAQTPVEILTREERLVEVPHILEKIVEKIVIMPQIVEVLKYVHEVIETEELGIAVGVDVMTHEQRYKILVKDLKGSLDLILIEIRKLKTSNPGLRVQIELIEKFLTELDKFILFPKIVQVPVEKIVEKTVEVDRIVRVPTQDERSLKMELTLSLLVEKLIVELKRLKRQNPNLELSLEDDVRFIFFGEFDNRGTTVVNEDINGQLKAFSDAIYRKFHSLGDWTTDHQLMLNSFLQERFVMANIVKNANLEIEKSRQISEKRLEGLRRYKNEKLAFETYMKTINESLPKILVFTKSNPELKDISITLEGTLRDYDKFIVSTLNQGEPLRLLDSVNVTDQRINSLIREKDSEILKLKERLVALEKARITTTGGEHNERTILALKTENTQLKNELSQLRSKAGDPNVYASYQVNIKGLNDKILQLEQEKSDLTTQLRNLKNEYEVRLNFSKGEVEQLQIRLDKSGVHSYNATENTPDKNRTDNDAKFNRSGATALSSTLGGASSNVVSPNYTSPMNKMTSPDIKMVESTYRPGESAGNRSSVQPTPGGGVSGLASNLTSSGSRGQASYSGSTEQRPSTYGATGTGGYSSTGSYGTGSSSTYGATGTTGTAGNYATGQYGAQQGATSSVSSSYGATGNYGTSSGSYGTAGNVTGGTGAGYGSTNVGGATTYGAYGTTGATGLTGATNVTGTSGLGTTSTSGTLGGASSRYSSSTSGATGPAPGGYQSTYRYNRDQPQ